MCVYVTDVCCCTRPLPTPRSINYDTCETHTLVNKLHIAHGVLMSIAWGVLLPVGIIIARFYRHVQPRTGPRAFWFLHHQIFQYSGTIIAATAFIIALYMCRNTGNFINAHGKLGLVVMILGLLQPLNAWIRPHPGAPYRTLWSAWHKTSGYCAAVLAIAAIFLGLAQVDAATRFRVAYGVVAGCLVGFYLVKLELALAPTRTEKRVDRVSESAMRTFSAENQANPTKDGAFHGYVKIDN